MKYIKLTRGLWTIVDDIDADLEGLFSWCAHENGHKKGKFYARTLIKGLDNKQKDIFLHQLILDRMVGYIDETKLETDHRNRNTLDNRRNNLRRVTRSVNMKNRDVIAWRNK